MQSKLQVGRLCTAATGRAAAGSCSGWLPSWAGPPPPGRLRAPVPIRKPGDGIGWMDGRNILGRARAAGRGRGRSTSSYSRSVGGRLRRRLGSAVSSRSSLERENGSPVVRADRDVAFWTGARELGLVLRVCGDPWRCHGVAGCRAERPVDPWAPRLGSAGPRRARALLCTARASRPRERRARRAVRWFCLRGFTPIDSPSPRSAVPQWQERRASRGVASAAAVR